MRLAHVVQICGTDHRPPRDLAERRLDHLKQRRRLIPGFLAVPRSDTHSPAGSPSSSTARSSEGKSATGPGRPGSNPSTESYPPSAAATTSNSPGLAGPSCGVSSTQPSLAQSSRHTGTRRASSATPASDARHRQSSDGSLNSSGGRPALPAGPARPDQLCLKIIAVADQPGHVEILRQSRRQPASQKSLGVRKLPGVCFPVPAGPSWLPGTREAAGRQARSGPAATSRSAPGPPSLITSSARNRKPGLDDRRRHHDLPGLAPRRPGHKIRQSPPLAPPELSVHQNAVDRPASERQPAPAAPPPPSSGRSACAYPAGAARHAAAAIAG